MILKKYFVINITLEDLIIIHIAIEFNNMNKFFQASSKLVLNSLVDFLRYISFFIFLLLNETVFKFQISYLKIPINRKLILHINYLLNRFNYQTLN